MFDGIWTRSEAAEIWEEEQTMPGPSEVFIPGKKAEGASKRRWGFRLVHHALAWQSTHSRPKQTAFLQIIGL